MKMTSGPIGILIHQDAANEKIIQLPLSADTWCGCFYDYDQRRIVRLKNAKICPACDKVLSKEPVYMHDVLRNPDMNLGERASPRIDLYAAKKILPDAISMTIVMPVYNAQDAVLKSMPQLFTTTMGDWELVIVLDACYDHSFDVVQTVIQEYFAKSSCCRVRVLIQPTAIWETSSDNLGMRISNPLYCYVLVQADNIMMEPSWNLRMWKHFEQNSKIFAVSARCAHQIDGNDYVGRCEKDIAVPLTEPIDNILHIRETANRGPLMLHSQRAQTLGFLDETRFLLENDEHDLNRRAAERGWLAGYLAVQMYAPLELSSRRNPLARIHVPLNVIAKEEKYKQFRRFLATSNHDF
jgi:GT2 family glycosyltransferase